MMSVHWTWYGMRQIQQTDVCLCHDPDQIGCLTNHKVATFYCFFNHKFQHGRLLNIITGPKMAMRVMNAPMIEFNVVAVCGNIFGFHLSNRGVYRFSIPNCRDC
jgi:hypothetical protein